MPGRTGAGPVTLTSSTLQATGSIVGLLGYPLLVEPNLRLTSAILGLDWGIWSVLGLCSGSDMGCLAKRSQSSGQGIDGCRTYGQAATHGMDTIGRGSVEPSPKCHHIPHHGYRGDTAIVGNPPYIYLVSFVLVFSRREIIPHEVMVKLSR